MSTGNIVQIIGTVVDVEFPRESIPKVYEALTLKGGKLVFEVQQQLGDGVVRTIAMGSSEGLKRGLEVENTGAPITVPVGEKTLGRLLDVLGNPVDEAGPVDASETRPIHAKAPTFEDGSLDFFAIKYLFLSLDERATSSPKKPAKKSWTPSTTNTNAI
jgi:F-type H+-transporting ATPase subunit beta